jgi:asparagine synthase (glutamine-hydrolysing)
VCGIAGIFARDARPDPRLAESIRAMTRRLAHRGPDDEGYLVEPSLALGHRRLSVIDLEGGRQPIANEDGSVHVVANGEIYNHLELRERLEGKGHRFSTRGDSEAIVHAYEEWGASCVDELRGMFAFALWDRRAGRLLLARDRIGKKPLYHASVGRAFVFGSEIKALLCLPGIARDLDLEALKDYCSLGYVPGEKTIFRSVRKLRPGHLLIAGRDQVLVRSYWDVAFDPDPPPRPPAPLRPLLEDAVRVRLRSDVPVGAFLSGGVDSSSIVALMSRASASRVETACMGFDEEALDERRYARLVSEHLGTEHREQSVSAAGDADTLRALAWHFDEPFADTSALPTYLLSKLVRGRVKVALSGDGGDELFAGYRRYRFEVLENRVRAWLPSRRVQRALGWAGAHYPKADFLPRVLRAKSLLSDLGRTPWEANFHSVSPVTEADAVALLHADVRGELGDYRTAHIFERLHAAARDLDPLSRAQYVDMKTYLPDDLLVKVDRASMAHGLEVRCPLLDHHVVEYAAGLPAAEKWSAGRTKKILVEAMRADLPPEILSRGKMGFVLPTARWLRSGASGLLRSHVLDSNRRHRLFDQSTIDRFWREHRRGLRDRSSELAAVLCFNLWHERFAAQATGAERAPRPL